jgi:EAL domain-containing protein (putative c-di-GMP-specific phosphodiesterase class I)
VNHLGSEDGASAVLHAVLGLARSLSLSVVAEGVETEAQLGLLREMGFDCAQGFLLGRPAPVPDVWALFAP